MHACLCVFGVCVCLPLWVNIPVVWVLYILNPHPPIMFCVKRFELCKNWHCKTCPFYYCYYLLYHTSFEFQACRAKLEPSISDNFLHSLRITAGWTELSFKVLHGAVHAKQNYMCQASNVSCTTNETEYIKFNIRSNITRLTVCIYI